MQLNLRPRWQLLCERIAPLASALLALWPGQRATAAVLPEERADALYHLYDGGGQTVQGPALLVRKNFAERLAVTGGYYVDRISGASIDVVTNASRYTEERTEFSGGAELLHRDTTLSVGVTNSDENDYQAQTLRFGVSQDLFQSRTTVALGYASGRDDVGRVGTSFNREASRDAYSLAVTQVVNPALVASLAYEITADAGYLQNPYRSARVQGGSVPEVYPGTRTGHALSLRLVHGWHDNGSLRVDGRVYRDSWQVQAFNLGVGVAHRLPRGWIAEASYRYYVQDAASFYADDFAQPLDFMSRDKELASFTGHTVGGRLTVPLARWPDRALNAVDLGVAAYYMDFRYRDFTDVRDGGEYGFGAVVAQAFLTFRY